MKTFSVTATGYVTAYTTIEAESLEEAKEKAFMSNELSESNFKIDNDLEINWGSMDVTEIFEE